MGEFSKIGWTDHTFNPWIGCQKVSAACDNCYAEAWDNRYGGERWGPHATRTRTSESNWNNPMRWDRKAARAGARARVFCASLADVFDNHPTVKPEWRAELWRVIRATPNLDWQLLTKRPQNIRPFLPRDWGMGYPNVWLGTTVEDQKTARQRIKHLVAIPAAVRFLSCEPILGPIDLQNVEVEGGLYDFLAGDRKTSTGEIIAGPPRGVGTVDWVITGGESGPGFREPDMDWYRGLRDQCAETRTPFFFKQHSGATMRQIERLGRDLDGREWNEFPLIVGDGDNHE